MDKYVVNQDGKDEIYYKHRFLKGDIVTKYIGNDLSSYMDYEWFDNGKGIIGLMKMSQVTPMKKSVDDLILDVLQWSKDRKILDQSSSKDQYIKACEEMGELANAIMKGDKDEAEDAFGDILVCLINAAAIMDISIRDSLERAYNTIKDRKGIMYQGCFIKESDPNYTRICKLLGEGE